MSNETRFPMRDVDTVLLANDEDGEVRARLFENGNLGIIEYDNGEAARVVTLPLAGVEALRLLLNARADAAGEAAAVTARWKDGERKRMDSWRVETWIAAGRPGPYHVNHGTYSDIQEPARAAPSSEAPVFTQADADGLAYVMEHGELPSSEAPVGETNYPCADCGVPRTKDQGGTMFTVCDDCWDRKYKKASEAPVGAVCLGFKCEQPAGHVPPCGPLPPSAYAGDRDAVLTAPPVSPQGDGPRVGERMFPVLAGSQSKEYQRLGMPRSVPWRLLAPHEEQAQNNHSQSLETLASRGGLGPMEMRCIVEGVKLRVYMGMTPADEFAWLTSWLAKAVRRGDEKPQGKS